MSNPPSFVVPCLQCPPSLPSSALSNSVSFPFASIPFSPFPPPPLSLFWPFLPLPPCHFPTRPFSLAFPSSLRLLWPFPPLPPCHFPTPSPFPCLSFFPLPSLTLPPSSTLPLSHPLLSPFPSLPPFPTPSPFPSFAFFPFQNPFPSPFPSCLPFSGPSSLFFLFFLSVLSLLPFLSHPPSSHSLFLLFFLTPSPLHFPSTLSHLYFPCFPLKAPIQNFYGIHHFSVTSTQNTVLSTRRPLFWYQWLFQTFSRELERSDSLLLFSTVHQILGIIMCQMMESSL